MNNKQQTAKASAIRPLWSEDPKTHKIAISNFTELSDPQQKYLKKYLGKKLTPELREKLIAEILQVEGPVSKKLPAAPVNEQMKVVNETQKAQQQTAASSDKKPKNNPAPKAKRTFKAGDIIPLNAEVGIKVLPETEKPKVGMQVFVLDVPTSTPNVTVDMSFEVVKIASRTAWLYQPDNEDMIPVSKKAFLKHHLDIDEKDPEDKWERVYIGELVDIPKQQHKPQTQKPPAASNSAQKPETKKTLRKPKSEKKTA